MSINFSHRTLILTYITWWLCWMVLQTIVLHNTLGFSWPLSIQDAFVTNVILASEGYALLTVMRFYQPRQILRFVWSVGISVGSVLFIQWITHEFLSEDKAYLAFVDQSLFIRCLFAWLMISLITIISWMWFYMHEQQELQIRKTDTEKIAREAELSKLRLQLQPHFLFNSLNSISALAGAKPEEARKMIQQLSDFLRGTIKYDDQQLVTLEEELAHLQLYLSIEKVRFGHRLKTEIEKTDEATALMLPSLLLQPIVENAIKFGLYETIGEITISVHAEVLEKQLVLTVKNPFDPTMANPKQGVGFGLTSVQRRLYLLYARQDLLSTSQHEHTFTTQVKIPQSL